MADKKAGSATANKATKPAAKKVDGETAAVEAIARFAERYRAMGERIHSLVLRSAPALKPTTWYGMPAYAKDGKVICFFRADRYMTFGLTDNANLALEADAKHQLRASSWFFDALDDATEAELAAIVRKAAG